MTATVTPVPAELSDDGMRAMLTELGIVTVTTDVFHYGDYKYTNIKDAVAEAKRHPRPVADG